MLRFETYFQMEFCHFSLFFLALYTVKKMGKCVILFCNFL